MMDVFESGDDKERDSQVPVLLNMTTMGEAASWCGVQLLMVTVLVSTLLGGAMTGVRYRDEVIEPFVVPFAANAWENFIFMDDNARPHRARRHLRTIRRFHL